MLIRCSAVALQLLYDPHRLQMQELHHIELEGFLFPMDHDAMHNLFTCMTTQGQNSPTSSPLTSTTIPNSRYHAYINIPSPCMPLTMLLAYMFLLVFIQVMTCPLPHRSCS